MRPRSSSIVPEQHPDRTAGQGLWVLVFAGACQGTAWAGLCLIHHHHQQHPDRQDGKIPRKRGKKAAISPLLSHGRRPHRARPEPRPNHRYARQGRRNPLHGQLRHLKATPRQHRRRATRRRPARGAGSAVNMRRVQGGLGRSHGNGGLRRDQRHLKHRNRGTARTPLAPRRCALHAAKNRLTPALHPAARARAQPPRPNCMALRRAGTPGTARVAAHAPPPHQPQPQDSGTHMHAALRVARTAPARRAPPLVAAPPTPATAHERRRTTTKRCCVPTRAQSRRRRSMGYGRTGPSPRQKGGRLPPPMRARLTPPHGRHHKRFSCTRHAQHGTQ